MNSILLIAQLLEENWEISVRKINGDYQFRLTAPGGRMSMAEHAEWESALQTAAQLGGFQTD